MSDQPSCTYTEKVIDRLLGVIRQLQLPLKCRNRSVAKIFVDPPVYLKSLVVDRKHIRLLICEMFERMIPKVLYRLLTNPLTFLFLFSEIEQLI